MQSFDGIRYCYVIYTFEQTVERWGPKSFLKEFRYIEQYKILLKFKLFFKEVQVTEQGRIANSLMHHLRDIYALCVNLLLLLFFVCLFFSGKIDF